MATPLPENRIRELTISFAGILIFMGGLLAITWGEVDRLEGTVADLRKTVAGLEGERSRNGLLGSVSPLLLEYQLDLPGRGEVFPAMATTIAGDYWPVAVLRVTNTATRAVAQTISAEIPGWSRPTEQSLVVGPSETRRLPVQPELLPRAYQNNEIRHAQLEIRARGPDGDLLFAESRPVLIHGGSEIYWGRKFVNTQVAARWVTPHDPAILDLVSKARGYIPRGHMAGYNPSTGDATAIARHVRAQSIAIFRAMQESQITYVNSIFVMGEYVDMAQRLRLPRETLKLKTANCMDVSVVFASAMENLGMQPLLVIVPGHAFTGVRLGPDSDQVLYLDLTVLPKGSFDSAVARARSWLAKTPGEEVLVVDVASTRVLGIYPLVSEES